MKVGDLIGQRGIPVKRNAISAIVAGDSAVKEYKGLEARKNHKFRTYFPDTGPLRRELYPRHMVFFDAGSLYRFRCFRAANRIGKTEAAAFELAHHMVGEYPSWWTGKRFDCPIEVWAANISWEKVRDVNQNALMGNPQKPEEEGSGFLPPEHIIRRNYHGFSKFGMDTVAVRHVSGGVSLLQFKAYTQGSASFESNAKHVIWLDEEFDLDINAACEMRTMTVNGIIMMTYTPILGLTEVTELYEKEAVKL